MLCRSSSPPSPPRALPALIESLRITFYQHEPLKAALRELIQGHGIDEERLLSVIDEALRPFVAEQVQAFHLTPVSPAQTSTTAQAPNNTHDHLHGCSVQPQTMSQSLGLLDRAGEVPIVLVEGVDASKQVIDIYDKGKGLLAEAGSEAGVLLVEVMQGASSELKHLPLGQKLDGVSFMPPEKQKNSGIVRIKTRRDQKDVLLCPADESDWESPQNPDLAQLCDQFELALAEEDPLRGVVYVTDLEPSDQPWIQPLQLQDNKLDDLEHPIPGISTPYYYIGPRSSPFVAHTEDVNLCSWSRLHRGYKVWYVISPADKIAFEELVSTSVDSQRAPGDERCAQSVREEEVFVTRGCLDDHGIRYNVVLQRPGQIIMTLPGAYHMGFSASFTIADAQNFAHSEWNDLETYCYCENRNFPERITRESMQMKSLHDHQVQSERERRTNEQSVASVGRSAHCSDTNRPGCKTHIDASKSSQNAPKRKRSMKRLEALKDPHGPTSSASKSSRKALKRTKKSAKCSEAHAIPGELVHPTATPEQRLAGLLRLRSVDSESTAAMTSFLRLVLSGHGFCELKDCLQRLRESFRGWDDASSLLSAWNRLDRSSSFIHFLRVAILIASESESKSASVGVRHGVQGRRRTTRFDKALESGEFPPEQLDAIRDSMRQYCNRKARFAMQLWRKSDCVEMVFLVPAAVMKSCSNMSVDEQDFFIHFLCNEARLTKVTLHGLLEVLLGKAQERRYAFESLDSNELSQMGRGGDRLASLCVHTDGNGSTSIT